MNKVMLIGRLGRDPELRYAQNGTPVANLRIATDESYVDREGNKLERVEWHTVVVFQRAAENCANYLGKGSLVFVEGSLQTRKWQDQQGHDRYSTDIKAQRVQFLDRRSDTAQQPGDDATPRHAVGQGARQQNRGSAMDNQTYADDLGPAFPSEGSGMDDIPF